MQIGYLGPLEVRDAHGAVDVPGRRLRTLLGRLAVDVGRAVPHRTLIEALWPDEAPADPANALQSLVSRLRRTLGDPSAVEQLAGGYRLNMAADDVDAVRFGALAAQGHAQLAAGAPVLAAETLASALALWRGEPLPDDESLDAEAVRARLADVLLQARADRIEADLTGTTDAGDPSLSGLVAELDQLVTEHPLREDLAALRMRALVAAGRPAEALAAYESTRSYLAETLGSDPSSSLQEQHLAVLRLQDAGLRTTRTNLRAAVTSFVGRDDDARKVNKLLGDGRLVTIVGTGGAGKTRLASEVAASWVGRAPDGVWFVELAPVSDADNVSVAVLDGLEIRDIPMLDSLHGAERPPREARARVLQSLADAESLVVIDNCEHVVDAVAGLVADILGMCPGVRVIATSREPLGIDGESLFALTPLTVPGAGAATAEVAGSAAVRLLLDRAAAVGADLTLDESTVADVVEVVRRLDGLPLAIELAAARLRVLSIAEVASRLADRFRLLTGGRRTAMPRHRTLRAVVEWSWELLSPLEREVAEHFSVFGSGATVDAVEAVSPSGATGLEDVLHALVDKSLLVAAQDAGGVRYRMLETLREYGSERLAEQGTLEAARLAHAQYFAQLVRTADAHLRTDRQVLWLRRLDAERDNVLTALAYLGEHDRPADALDMTVAMAWGWMLRENGKDSARWLRFALDAPGASELPMAVVAEAMYLITSIGAFSTPETGEEAIHRRAALIEMAGRLEPVEGLHHLVSLLRPMMLFFAEEREAAADLVQRALDHADPWSRAATRTMHIMFSENEGEIESMRGEIAEALAEWQQVGDHWGLAAILSSRGQLRTLDGDTEGAAADFEEALAQLRQLGSGTDDLQVYMRLADLRMRAGDLDGARRYAELVRGSGETRGGFDVGIFGDVILAAVAFEQGDTATYEAASGRMLAMLDEHHSPTIFLSHGTAMAHGFLGSMAAQTGDLAAARKHVETGYRHALVTLDQPIIASVGLGVAAYAFALGDHRDAAVILGAAARLRGSDDHTNLAIVRLTASLQESLGDAFDDAFAEGRALDRDAARGRLDPAQLG
ncbi:BTAD domain-containing putative transcriptional regulator [Acidothermaceae bacterium B102]|nr:BTAD domain-containing putative transcriptional regulator [Acidothermaceae bacterium B102]